MAGCWRPVLQILGGRKAPVTAVGRSARACARASARFPYDRLGQGWGGVARESPVSWLSRAYRTWGFRYPLSLFLQASRWRRGGGGQNLTRPSRPAHSRGFLGLCFGFFQFHLPNPRDMNGSRQRGRCRPEFGAVDLSPKARGPAIPATKFR